MERSGERQVERGAGLLVGAAKPAAVFITAAAPARRRGAT